MYDWQENTCVGAVFLIKLQACTVYSLFQEYSYFVTISDHRGFCIAFVKNIPMECPSSQIIEAVVRRCSINSQDSQENTCARVSFLIVVGLGL